MDIGKYIDELIDMHVDARDEDNLDDYEKALYKGYIMAYEHIKQVLINEGMIE